MDVKEVAEALIDENKHLFDLKLTSPNIVSISSDPSSCIHIHEVNICNNGNEYRITVSMSANMLASLGNYKLCVGYVRCRLYEWFYNKNCNKCNEPGHHKSKCSNPRACSRCGEDHDSKDCTSKVFRCSNCVKHKKEKIDHPAYSSDCPFNQC